MDQLMVVRTEKGRAESLKQVVKIAFTLTPAKTEGSGATYDPILAKHMEFPADSEERYEFGWDTGLGFGGFKSTPYGEMTDCSYSSSDCVDVMPGHARTMTASRDIYRDWTNPTYDANNPTSVVAINKTGSASNTVLVAKLDRRQYKPCPIVAYHNLPNGGRIIASADLELQAYVVAFSAEPSFDGILTPEYLNRPLFPTPIPCRYIQSLNYPELGTRMAKSMYDMRGQLAAVLKSLGDTQQRLAVVEDSLADNQAELSKVQTLVTTARDEVDRIDRTVSGVRNQAAKLDASLTHSAERLALVEKSLIRAHEDLASEKKTTVEFRHQLKEVHKPATAGPILEAQVEKLAQSMGRTQDDVINVQKSFFVTHNQVADINASVIAHRDMLADLTTHRIPALEAKLNEKDNTGVIEGQIRSPVGKPTRQAQEPPAVLETVRSLQSQVAALDRQIPAIEAKTEKLARGYGQTLENLTSVNKYLQTTRQQVAGLESKVPRMETKVEKLMATQVVNEDGLAVLTSRVEAVEERVDRLSDIAGRRGSPSFPSVSGSPITFPGQPSGTALGDVLARDPPWLSLPRPLDPDSPKP